MWILVYDTVRAMWVPQADEEPLYIFDPSFAEAAPGMTAMYDVPRVFEEVGRTCTHMAAVAPAAPVAPCASPAATPSRATHPQRPLLASSAGLHTFVGPLLSTGPPAPAVPLAGPGPGTCGRLVARGPVAHLRLERAAVG